MLPLTQNAINASEQLGKSPQLVLEIEGITTLFGALRILKYIQIGDTGLEIGDDWVIGGKNEVEDQEDLISFDGTNTSISQQLLPDKGAASSISAISVELLDKGMIMSQVISPGVLITDIIGTKCRLWMGFQSTAYPDDYVEIFSGSVSDVEAKAATVRLNLVHPDEKKRQKVFKQVKVELAEDIAELDNPTTLDLVSTDGLHVPSTKPDGTDEDGFRTYVKINEEVFRYTGISGKQLTGVTREQLGSVAAEHDSGDKGASFYWLNGDAMELALKFMLSGWSGAFVDEVAIHSFLQVSPVLSVDGAIFFKGVNLASRYGLTAGDFITVTGATKTANNVTAAEILEVVESQDGSYVTVDEDIESEIGTSATASFRSQYDTLPDGLKMSPDEVDVAEHQRLRSLFLGGFNYTFYFDDEVDGKSFLESGVYKPAAAYAIPRKGRSSVGLHIPPLPTDQLLILDEDNVEDPSKLVIRRGISRNFMNEVQYRWDQSATGKGLQSGELYESDDSKTRIKVGRKTFGVEATGLRGVDGAATLSQVAANRRLNRYQFAAEYLNQVRVLFKAGFRLEVGDLVVLDPSGLRLVNTEDGNRKKSPKIFEVVNIKKDLRGKATIDLVDTNYADAERYGLISPASLVRAGVSVTEFTIKESYGAPFGPNEWRKWTDLIGAAILVRSADFSRKGSAILQSISGNSITLDASLGFTPEADDIMELAHYDLQPETVKLRYTFMSDDDFDDDKPQYKMI